MLNPSYANSNHWSACLAETAIQKGSQWISSKAIVDHASNRREFLDEYRVIASKV
jgi:hypothetical protein